MKNPAESGVSAGFFSVCMSGLADLYDGVHADLDGLLVHRDEVVVTGRKRLLQSGCHILHLMLYALALPSLAASSAASIL